MDYAQARDRMISHQLRPRGVDDSRLLKAFGEVARHRFAPAGLAPVQVYADVKLRLGPGAGQWLEEPVVAARVLDLLSVQVGTRVLEVGTGSGYTAALLAALGAQVVTVERDAELAHAAEVRLRDLAARRSGTVVDREVDLVEVCWAHRCGRTGWPGQAPFDRIWLSGGVEELPAELADQLAPGGFVIAPRGRRHTQELVRARPRIGTRPGSGSSTDGAWEIESLGRCRFEMLLSQRV